ncbi:MAG TPA: hypothetical protein VMS00_11160 [Acidimicrobiales bacterium]|nr:hypothetical protein [Acidimicrobiales bacterium]
MPGRKRESGRKKGGAGARDGASDLLQLIIAYAKQETLDPVVRQLKKLGWGVAGGACMALGTAFLALGFVRALQTEFGTARQPGLAVFRALNSAPRVVHSSALPGSSVSFQVAVPNNAFTLRTGLASPFGAGAHLSGDWSWVPYMGGVLFCLLVAGFCVLRIVKGVAR